MRAFSLLLIKNLPVLQGIILMIISLSTIVMTMYIMLSYILFFYELIPGIVTNIILLLIVLLLVNGIIKLWEEYNLYGVGITSVLIQLIIILSLLTATFSSSPYYFDYLRSFILIVLLLLIFREYRKQNLIWAYIDHPGRLLNIGEGLLISATYTVILIIFNPIFPFYFYDKNIWIFIDVVAALILIVVTIRDINIGIKLKRIYLEYKTDIELEGRIVLKQKIIICEKFKIDTDIIPEINYPDDYPSTSPIWTFKEKILLGDYDLYFPN